MDFTIIPEALKHASPEQERPRNLRQMAELLKIAYQLTDHPLLKNWKGYEAIDFFNRQFFDVEKFKRFNRTIIERTISQAEFFASIESERGVLTMSSKGIEFSILTLESFLVDANKIHKASEDELQQIGPAVHYFRITRSGELEASITFLMDICNNLIELTQRNFIIDQLQKIKNNDEKVRYLLRQKANLLQQKNQFDEKVFNHVMEAIEIELGFHKDVQQYLDIPAELKAVVNQFLAEKQARISNNKLLGYLMQQNLDEFCKGLSELVLQLFSYHDIGGQEPEKVYHAFLLGAFNSFKDVYNLQSNREAGTGRFDILLIPETLEYKGVIIEVKRATSNYSNAINSLLDEALQQIVDNKYAIELKVRGHNEYIGIAAVFFGKELRMKYKLYSMDV